jgi:hypothetical protein
MSAGCDFPPLRLVEPGASITWKTLSSHAFPSIFPMKAMGGSTYNTRSLRLGKNNR